MVAQRSVVDHPAVDLLGLPAVRKASEPRRREPECIRRRFGVVIGHARGHGAEEPNIPLTLASSSTPLSQSGTHSIGVVRGRSLAQEVQALAEPECLHVQTELRGQLRRLPAAQPKNEQVGEPIVNAEVDADAHPDRLCLREVHHPAHALVDHLRLDIRTSRSPGSGPTARSAFTPLPVRRDQLTGLGRRPHGPTVGEEPRPGRATPGASPAVHVGELRAGPSRLEGTSQQLGIEPDGHERESDPGGPRTSEPFHELPPGRVGPRLVVPPLPNLLPEVLPPLDFAAGELRFVGVNVDVVRIDAHPQFPFVVGLPEEAGFQPDGE